MTLRLSNRLLVSSNIENKACPIPVSYASSGLDTLVDIDFRSCTVGKKYGQKRPISIYVVQNSDAIFQFTDIDDSVVYSSASNITFDVWDSVNSISTNRISKTSAASEITTPDDHIINVTLTDSDTSIDPGSYYFELWVVTNAGSQYRLRYGDFIVQDSRSYD